jgi:hypothetical protein
VINALPYHLAIRIATAAKNVAATTSTSPRTCCHQGHHGDGGRRRHCLHAAVRTGARLHRHRGASSQGFDSLDEIKMRVGALPAFPTNALKYNLTWSVDGLINEYCHPCEAIHEAR